MTNNDLAKAAAELERQLKLKIKCYLVVGWIKESDSSTVFAVYVDQRSKVDERTIPIKWYGRAVWVHPVIPPGVDEPTFDFSIW